LYKLWLLAYAQAFPNFVLLSFVAPFPTRMPSRTRFGIVSLGEAEKGTGTMMEVHYIATKVPTKST
jgi:hypothetical protein